MSEENETEAAANERRPIRADARRNIDALLQAAMAVFAASGVDAPMREIADQAGVGVGTIYRHFPLRADLIVAVCRREVDLCAQAATALAAQHPPRTALIAWVGQYINLVSAKQGLAAALHGGNPAYDGLPSYFEDRLSPALEGLLKAAATAGEIRGDVKAWDLLWAIAGLCAPKRTGDAEVARRMIDLLLDGLRAAPDA